MSDAIGTYAYLILDSGQAWGRHGAGTGELPLQIILSVRKSYESDSVAYGTRRRALQRLPLRKCCLHYFTKVALGSQIWEYACLGSDSNI